MTSTNLLPVNNLFLLHKVVWRSNRSFKKFFYDFLSIPLFNYFISKAALCSSTTPSITVTRCCANFSLSKFKRHSTSILSLQERLVVALSCFRAWAHTLDCCCIMTHIVGSLTKYLLGSCSNLIKGWLIVALIQLRCEILWMLGHTAYLFLQGSVVSFLW